MNIQDIEKLNLNPFWCSKLISYYLKGFPKQRTTMEYLYLLLPIILTKDTRDILNKSNSSSSFATTFIHNDKGHLSLVSIKRNFPILKKLTLEALIVACNEGKLCIEDNYIISKDSPKHQDEKNMEIRTFYRAAHYLGVILSKEQPLELYAKFNIRKI